MELLLVINDCLSEDQPGEFHWKCRADELNEQLDALLLQQLLPTPDSATITVSELTPYGVSKLAEFPLDTASTGFLDLHPASFDAFQDLCGSLARKYKLREEK